MDSKLILVTGGARSGKSSFSERLILENCRRPAYVATCPVLDAETAERLRLHRARREAGNWITVEEETDLAAAFDRAEAARADGVLVDCLTLWINNLLYRNPEFSEQGMRETLAELLPRMRCFPGPAVLVLNEVGLGLVPETPLGRRFRDLSGRCGQLVAAEADELYFVVCGIPQRIK